MNCAISNISSIRFGLHAQPVEHGRVAYLQVRHFDTEGILSAPPDEFIDTKDKSSLLHDGDVLFVGKGNRLFAWCYRRHQFGPCVASSIFFILRTNPARVYPEYLEVILNTPQAKAVFRQMGSGTNIFSLRKSELGAYQVPLPSLEQQKTIVTIAALARQEVMLARQLADRKQQLYITIISKLTQ